MKEKILIGFTYAILAYTVIASLFQIEIVLDLAAFLQKIYSFDTNEAVRDSKMPMYVLGIGVISFWIIIIIIGIWFSIFSGWLLAKRDSKSIKWLRITLAIVVVRLVAGVLNVWVSTSDIQIAISGITNLVDFAPSICALAMIVILNKHSLKIYFSLNKGSAHNNCFNGTP